MGVIPRAQIANDIKALDQDARGMLRKHGVRFGQFTIFMPLLLKPAPTRLRLVLRSLHEGLDEFPESPPPGLVTIPHITEVPGAHYTMAGYHPAGARAIRIDMLERLADLLRACDSRAGFEATPDMLSITGTTLEQFADLMQGLGYAAEKGEREKVKPVVEAPAADPEAPEMPTAEGLPAEIPADTGDTPAEAIADASETAQPAEADALEVFYTFTWAPRPRRDTNRPARKPEGEGRGPRKGAKGGKPKGDGRKGGKGDGRKPERDKRPTQAPKPQRIDPDNPFAAALAGFKAKD